MRFNKTTVIAVVVMLAISLPVSAQAAATSSDADAMVVIAGGEYVALYGNRGRPVQVAPFLLDNYPVTNAKFLDFVRDRAQWRREHVAPLFADQTYLSHWQDVLELGGLAPTAAPVSNVSWFAAKAYCQTKAKRLPTLDEWEFVARANEYEASAADEDAFNKLILNWYGKPARLPLPNVGYSFKNVWGVWDMHGLVWEWVMDFSAVMMTGESRKDASGLDRQLFCAAGAIGSADPNDYATFMRYAMRGSVKASYTGQNMGFRCAQDMDEGALGSSP
jgi:formylglycine-generating enzyme required for sulfatase activity